MSRWVAVLVVVLGLIAGNVTLGYLWLQERDAATIAGEQLADTTRDAKQCSDSVTQLAVIAASDAASAASAVAAAKLTAAQAEQRARRQQSTPPSTPGDDCKSASQRFDRWLTERATQ